MKMVMAIVINDDGNGCSIENDNDNDNDDGNGHSIECDNGNDNDDEETEDRHENDLLIQTTYSSIMNQTLKRQIMHQMELVITLQ